MKSDISSLRKPIVEADLRALENGNAEAVGLKEQERDFIMHAFSALSMRLECTTRAKTDRLLMRTTREQPQLETWRNFGEAVPLFPRRAWNADPRFVGGSDKNSKSRLSERFYSCSVVKDFRFAKRSLSSAM